jgi:proline dehydrogenase
LTLLGRLVIAVAGQSWIRRLVTEHRWGRSVATRFVAGETLDDAVRVSRELNGRGLSVSFDHLGEHTTDLRLAARARDDYLSCIERIASEGLDAGISVKLTQLGLGLDDSLAEQSLRTLAARAAAAGIGLTIDMEESAFTERTRDLYCRVQQGSGNLGVALQACLRRTPEDMRRLLPTGGLIRLCKGAYREPKSLAWQRGREVDRAFDFLLRDLMAAETVTPAIATMIAAASKRPAAWAVLARGNSSFRCSSGCVLRCSELWWRQAAGFGSTCPTVTLGTRISQGASPSAPPTSGSR